MQGLARSFSLVVLLGAGVVRAETCPAHYRSFSQREGQVGCERDLPGSDFREYLVVTALPVPPARVIDLLWGDVQQSRMDGLKHRQFLERSENAMVFYDQIRTPVVSDRDYTVRVERKIEPSRSVIHFSTVNERGPAPDPHHVRIPSLRATWIAEPDGKGGTRLSFITYSEPGGAVPAWMVRSTQQRRAITDVESVIRRLPNR